MNETDRRRINAYKRVATFEPKHLTVEEVKKQNELINSSLLVEKNSQVQKNYINNKHLEEYSDKENPKISRSTLEAFLYMMEKNPNMTDKDSYFDNIDTNLNDSDGSIFDIPQEKSKKNENVSSEVSFTQLDLTELANRKNLLKENQIKNQKTKNKSANIQDLTSKSQTVVDEVKFKKIDLKNQKKFFQEIKYEDFKKDSVKAYDGFSKLIDPHKKNLESLICENKENRFSKQQEYLKENTYKKIAKFLIIIGPDKASKVISLLKPEQTEKIIPELTSIKTIDSNEAIKILDEFKSLCSRIGSSGGLETAKNILEKAFGTEKAEEMLQNAVPFPDGEPFEYLQNMDIESIFFILSNESIFVKTLILSKLKPAKSAAIINKLEKNEKNEIIKRLVNLKKISPDIVRRVDEIIKKKASNIKLNKESSLDGRSILASILRTMDLSTGRELLSSLDNQDPELTNDMKKRLFTIDDLLNVDNRYIQQKLVTMTDIDIAVLIYKKNENFRNKILNNVSQGRKSVILQEEDMRKFISKKESDSITNLFFDTIRTDWENGNLYIAGRDDVVL